MSTARGSTVPWTDPAFGPDAEAERTELSPYRVRLGDDLYDQSAFTANTSHRYHNFTSGIGAGKTVAGIIRTVANALVWNPGELGMIVTPTSLGIKNVILPELSKWGILTEWEYNGPRTEQPGLVAPNGTRILLESADNQRKIERLRGPSLAWFWMDEPNIIPEKAWRILTGRLRAGNYRNAFITGTPKGYNWVHEKFVDEETRLDEVNNVLGVPSYANPHLPLDYRRDILDDYEGSFYEQEVLGEFVTFEGLVYRWFDPDDHVLESTPSTDVFDEFIYGVDFGFDNPSAILAIGKRGDEYVVLENFYESRCTEQDLAVEAATMQERWGPGRFYCDPSEPSAIQVFQNEGLNAQQAINDVTPGIRTVTRQQDSLQVTEACQAVRNEFRQYQYREDGTDDTPLKKNDHAMDALRYAIHTHEQRGGDVTHSKHSLGDIT
jgi:PBSX family phage terminase large subunit